MIRESPKRTLEEMIVKEEEEEEEEESFSSNSELRDEVGDLLHIGPRLMTAFYDAQMFDTDSLSSFPTGSATTMSEIVATSTRPPTAVLITGLCSIFFLVGLIFVSIGIATKWFTGPF
uniref:Uncharacterized protein n=1 Tax=Plectus sambesii TaxID=2011161 RepID=A0A914USC4_9BILA